MRKSILFTAVAAVAVLSLSACQTKAGEESTQTGSNAESTEMQSSEAKAEEGNYVYTKIDVPYADYYYGELLDLAADATKVPDYEKEDAVKAAGYRESGHYDSVSSATSGKAKNFVAAYHEVIGEGSEIYGVKGVNVAIDKELYEEAKKAVEAGTTAKNPLLDFVSKIESVSDTAPVEYKVLNFDGTLSKTVGKSEVNDKLTSEITTTSRYGNYEIEIKDLEIELDKIQGVVLETEDGKKFGLKHLENIWQKPHELAFSVKEFEESHGNKPDYMLYKDIEGKTIKKITYLLQDQDDVEISASLFCKLMLPEDYTVSGDESVVYSAEGTNVNYKLSTADSKYALDQIIYRNDKVAYTVDTSTEGVIKLPKEAVPGKYLIVFANEQYADMSFTTVINSELKAEDFVFENNTLAIKENAQAIDIKTYINSTSSATVGETEYKGGRGRRFGATIFNEDGTVNLDAVVKIDDKEVPVFEAAGTHKVTIKADGYPDISFEVVK